MKYKKNGFAITVDINEEYQVRALINKGNSDHTYEFSLELSHRDICRWQEIDADVIFSMQSQNINLDVANYIEKINRESYFDTAVESYDLYEKYISLGIQMTEAYHMTMQGDR